MMKKRESIHNKAYYYLFAVLAFTLPVNKRIVPIIIGLILLNWLIEGRYFYKYRLIKNNRSRQYLLSFALLYIMYLIGLLYTNNLRGQEGGYFDIEVKLSLIVFPLIISGIDSEIFSDKRWLHVLFSFVAGCIVASLMCLVNSTANFLESGITNEFYYINISGSLHPSYYSMYINFAIAGIIYIFIKRPITIRLWLKIVLGFLLFYFSLFVFLLSSKAGLISMFIVYGISVIHLLLFNKKYLTGIICLIIVVITCFLFFKILPGATSRIVRATDVVKGNKQISANTTESTSERILVWRSSLEIIGENLLFGVGTGDVKNELVEKYKENNIITAIEQRLNAHNQYLQTFIAIGLIGFLLLSLGLVIPAIICLKERNLIYFLFLIILGFNILVESMLETQAGVVFFAFFNSYLFFIRK